jgi:hypothetical protein
VSYFSFITIDTNKLKANCIVVKKIECIVLRSLLIFIVFCLHVKKDYPTFKSLILNFFITLFQFFLLGYASRCCDIRCTYGSIHESKTVRKGLICPPYSIFSLGQDTCIRCNHKIVILEQRGE